MSADTDGQGSGLVLSEGYVAEQYEDGRLRIYDTGTDGWLAGGDRPPTSQTSRRLPEISSPPTRSPRPAATI